MMEIIVQKIVAGRQEKNKHRIEGVKNLIYTGGQDA